jgi:subtilisin family serine protease
MKSLFRLTLLLLGAPAVAQDPAWLPAIESRLTTQSTLSVLIVVRPPSSTRERASAAETARPLALQLAADGLEVRHVYEHQPLILADVGRESLRQLSTRSEIAAVHENEYIRALDVEREGAQLVTSTPAVGADKAWAQGYRGQGFTIAVLDSGINAAHEMFRGKIKAEACFSDPSASPLYLSLCPGGVKSAVGPGTASLCPGAIKNAYGVCDHGSHVAAIAAGDNADPANRVRGVAPEAGLIAVQVFTRAAGCVDCLGAWTSDLIAAMDWLISIAPSHSIAAVNMSVGSTARAESCPGAALESGIKRLRELGVLTVIAAGNDGQTGALSYPGCIKAAVAVGSVSRAGTPSTFSNAARTLDLLAPGEAVRSAIHGAPAAYASYSGTSMATPHVAGAVAVLKSRMPGASADQIEHALKIGGAAVTSPQWNWTTPRLMLAGALGSGALNMVGIDPPPPGVIVSGVAPGKATAMQSMLRLANPGATSLTATVALREDRTGHGLGVHQLAIPGRATRQLLAAEIEAALGAPVILASSLVAIINADRPVLVQHIVVDGVSGTPANVTTCTQTQEAGSPARFFFNVNSLTGTERPSRITLVNAGERRVYEGFRIYNADTGEYVASVRIPTLLPGGSASYSAAELIAKSDNYMDFAFPRGASRRSPVVNLIREQTFEGAATHMVAQPGGGTVDMTRACLSD